MKTSSYVEVKVFDETRRKHETFRFRCPRGQRYDKGGAMQEMSAFVSDLQERVPGKIFRVVATDFNKFNVVHEVGNA